MTETTGVEVDVTSASCRPELERIENLPEILLDAEHRLEQLIKADDVAAKRQMIAHNLRMVVNIAKRYVNHGVALLDLIREGIGGLIHALEKFDLEGGFRFSAYAAQCVRHNIECAILNRMDLLPDAIDQTRHLWDSGIQYGEVAR